MKRLTINFERFFGELNDSQKILLELHTSQTLGESRVRVVTFDPSKSTDDIYDESVMNQRAKALPGLMEHMEPENEGMHTTDSVDYGVVISGNPKLELDDGETVDLEPGDIVIQNGTRHAWRFKDDEVTTMLWVLLGTKRN